MEKKSIHEKKQTEILEMKKNQFGNIELFD